MRFSPLLSSAHGNPIRSGDGQINRNTLICVAHVLKLDWDRTPCTPFHLSEEWQEGMERSRRGNQCSQWINSATVKTRQAETSQLSELFLPSASCLHAAQLHYGLFVRLVWVVKHVVLDSWNSVTQQIDSTSPNRAVVYVLLTLSGSLPGYFWSNCSCMLFYFLSNLSTKFMWHLISLLLKVELTL